MISPSPKDTPHRPIRTHYAGCECLPLEVITTIEGFPGPIAFWAKGANYTYCVVVNRRKVPEKCILPRKGLETMCVWALEFAVNIFEGHRVHIIVR